MSLSQNLKRRLQNWLGITELQVKAFGRQAIKAPGTKRSHGTGKVITAKKRTEYVPGQKPQGGRVVRIIPKELKTIKQGQERGDM